MPEYLSPGVYIEEFEIGARPIEGVSTSTAGFLGETERGTTKPNVDLAVTLAVVNIFPMLCRDFLKMVARDALSVEL